MKRIVAIVAALGIVTSACGGGDDADATAEQTASESATADEDATEAEPDAAAPDDESSGEQVAADADGEPSDDGDGGGVDGDDGGATRSISSLDDIPEECRDRMADFLREVEPIVSSIDWQTATIAEFEKISDEFDAKSTQFEEDFEGAGCDDLDFTDGNEFELMIDFAGDEAPGTVEFLEFLAAAGAGAGGAGSGGSGAPDTGFANCDEAVSFVQGLIDDYETFESVPAADLLKFSGLATAFVTCSPEQLEFFDSPEVNDFLGGE